MQQSYKFFKNNKTRLAFDRYFYNMNNFIITTQILLFAIIFSCKKDINQSVSPHTVSAILETKDSTTFVQIFNHTNEIMSFSANGVKLQVAPNNDFEYSLPYYKAIDTIIYKLGEESSKFQLITAIKP